jgi:PIN domain nuclease of toxin-antitoxin system
VGDKSVNLLLDTHVWLWAAEAPERLGPKTKNLLVKTGLDRSVSAISALEIARLCVEGHLILSIGLSRWIESSTDDLLLQHLPVTCSIAVEAYALPEPFHRDPADRLLVSTARIHQCTLLTANERLLDYKHVETLDCRL